MSLGLGAMLKIWVASSYIQFWLWPGLMLDIFSKVLYTGLDLLVPIRRVCVDTYDAPWMNDHLKSLILKPQKAFHDGNTESMLNKFYRNAVNRERKSG